MSDSEEGHKPIKRLSKSSKAKKKYKNEDEEEGSPDQHKKVSKSSKAIRKDKSKQKPKKHGHHGKNRERVEDFFEIQASSSDELDDGHKTIKNQEDAFYDEKDLKRKNKAMSEFITDMEAKAIKS